jgi:F1F0 ATPase subunit 2
MNNFLILALALVAGILLGAIFFGGLWWTVRKGVAAKNPAIWFLGSMLLRMAIALAGFYFVGRGDWRRLVSCLFGFIVARFIVMRLTSNLETKMGSARVPRASSGVAPELLPPEVSKISRAENFVERCFRRDAENHTPEARAPQPKAKEAGHAP